MKQYIHNVNLGLSIQFLIPVHRREAWSPYKEAGNIYLDKENDAFTSLYINVKKLILTAFTFPFINVSKVI